MQPSIPKGTRDFTPDVLAKRNYIFETIKSVFLLYGFQQIETPAMENLSTLLGKYGDEGDKLLFRILNSGDFLSDLPSGYSFDKTCAKDLLPYIAEKGLRYDLTVPFARFVAMHKNEITFPFKRFQIQPVWRADRPQKGRYREFYQCDIDIIGSKSILNEFELVMIINEVFQKLNINTRLHINNRKILDGLLQYFNLHDKLIPVATAIDKIDKIGIENVIEELKQHSIGEPIAKQIVEIITNKDCGIIEELKNIFATIEKGNEGLAEIEELFEYIKLSELKTEIKFDLSLARGLEYYTGTIFEVKAKDVQIGSICGGGRYDNLTQHFGLDDISGVGVSFGADRIFDVMNELNLFPDNIKVSTTCLFLNFGKNEIQYCLPLVKDLRKINISTEIYPDVDKIKKQLNYANKKNIPYVIIAGEQEIQNNKFILKIMQSGQQLSLGHSEIISFFQTI